MIIENTFTPTPSKSIITKSGRMGKKNFPKIHTTFSSQNSEINEIKTLQAPLLIFEVRFKFF